MAKESDATFVGGPRSIEGEDIDPGSVDTEVSRTKEEPVFNVKAYGAVGDGATIDQPAIQTAVDAAEAAGGGTVFVPPGTYLVDKSTNEVPSIDWSTPGIRLIGAGWSSVIKQADNSTADDEGGRMINTGPESEIAFLKLDGNWQNNTPISDLDDGGNVEFMARDSTMHHCLSVNATGDGIEPKEPNCNIHNNTFINCWEQAIHFWDSETVINDNICINTQNDASIRWYASSGWSNGDINDPHIHGNLIIGGETTGILIRGNGPTVHRPRIENNTILNAGGSGSSADDTNDDGIVVNDSVDPIIEGNVVENPTNFGIRVTTSCEGGTIEDNTVRHAGPVGILARNAPTAGGVDILDNDVEDGADKGILVNSQQEIGDGWLIKENRVRGHQTTGILVECVNYAFNEIRITDNDITNNNQSNGGGAGIKVDEAGYTVTGVDVLDNTVYSYSTPYHNNGLTIGTATGAINEGYVERNRVRNTQTNDIAIFTSVSGVRDNRPRKPVDVRNLKAVEGNESYHDGSGSNTAGPAFYDSSAGGWVSLVDGTTIA